jgi:hypothetical protein
MRRRTPLGRAFESALLVGSAVASTGCCGLWFTRWVEAYHYRNVVLVDPARLPPDLRQRYAPEPDLATCESICGESADACSIATLQLPTAEPLPHVRCDYREGPSEWRSVPASSVGKLLSRSRECQYMCRNDGREVKDCSVTFDEQRQPQTVAVCQYFVPAHCTDHIPSGRAPETLEMDASPLSSEGQYFARAARLEAASVLAFEELARQLARCGAPRRLIEGAISAATDERRHARTFAVWARRCGHVVAEPDALPSPRAGLLQLALANAAEGCVIETYSALIAAHQARHAAPSLRPALALIARDEAAHAQLSWDIWRWTWRRLAHGERATLRNALRAAVARLAQRLPSLPQELSARTGLPALPVAREMFGHLSAQLWERAAPARGTSRADRVAAGSRAPRRAGPRAEASGRARSRGRH